MRGKAEEAVSGLEATSTRSVAGIVATVGDSVARAAPAAEQTGQKCVAEAEAGTSVQKWNCAPRKMIPRSNAKIRTCSALRPMR